MSAQLADRSRSVGSVIQEWHPEDAAFWARTCNRIANRNLYAETLGQGLGIADVQRRGAAADEIATLADEVARLADG